jgi:alpha-beta hydrolase superfamily lysophospholipase
MAKEKGFATNRSGDKFLLSLFEDDLRYDIRKEIPKIKCPWLIIHGDADDRIPPGRARECYELATCKKRLIVYKGAPHTSRFSKEEFARVFEDIRDFLDEMELG